MPKEKKKAAPKKPSRKEILEKIEKGELTEQQAATKYGVYR